MAEPPNKAMTNGRRIVALTKRPAEQERGRLTPALRRADALAAAAPFAPAGGKTDPTATTADLTVATAVTAAGEAVVAAGALVAVLRAGARIAATVAGTEAARYIEIGMVSEIECEIEGRTGTAETEVTDVGATADSGGAQARALLVATISEPETPRSALPAALRETALVPALLAATISEPETPPLALPAALREIPLVPALLAV